MSIGYGSNQSGITAEQLAGAFPITGNVAQDAQLHQYFRERNPYAQGGIAPSYGGLQAGGNWLTGQINANRPNTFSGNNLGQPARTPGLDLLSTTKNPGIQSILDRYTGNLGGLGPNTDYNVSSVVKNPATQQLIDSSRSQVSGLNFDPNTNPYVLRGNTKSQDFADQISKELGTFTADKTANRAGVEDYAGRIAANDPAAQRNLGQETGAISNWYSDQSDPNSVAGRLNAIANRTSAGVHAATNIARDQATRNLNLRLQSGGLGSYATQQALDTNAGLNAQEAIRRGDLDRQNLATVLQGQQQLLGARSGLANQYAGLALLPGQARNQQAGAEIGQLGALGQQNQSNTQYTLDSPAIALAQKLGLAGQVQGMDENNRFNILESPETVMARRLGLLQGLGQVDQLNKFYGLGGQFPGASIPSVRPGQPGLPFNPLDYLTQEQSLAATGQPQPGQPTPSVARPPTWPLRYYHPQSDGLIPSGDYGQGPVYPGSIGGMGDFNVGDYGGIG